MLAKLRSNRWAAVLLLSLWAGAAAAETRYVDAAAPAPGDGRSWRSAFKYLQDALMTAAPGDEIRVAQGTCKPDAFVLSRRPSLGRHETFQLITGVTIRLSRHWLTDLRR